MFTGHGTAKDYETQGVFLSDRDSVALTPGHRLSTEYVWIESERVFRRHERRGSDVVYRVGKREL